MSILFAVFGLAIAAVVAVRVIGDAFDDVD